jgi:hypothetical protein
MKLIWPRMTRMKKNSETKQMIAKSSLMPQQLLQLTELQPEKKQTFSQAFAIRWKDACIPTPDKKRHSCNLTSSNAQSQLEFDLQQEK